MTDTLTPNNLTVNPDGTIGADFTGVVNARGIGMVADSATPAPPYIQPAADAVQWTRASDGALIATLVGYVDTPPAKEQYVNLDVLDQSAAGAYLFLRALKPPWNAGAGGPGQAWITIQSVNGVAQIVAGTQDANSSVQNVATVMDDTGASDYVRWGPSGRTTTKVMAGSGSFNVPVGSPAGITVPLPNGGWSSHHYVFLASVNPLSNWAGVGASFAEPQALNSGVVSIFNQSVAQGFNINWISFGI